MKNYLYLARRDKSTIKMLAILTGGEHPASRIADVKQLNLAIELEQKIIIQTKENKMLWELWLESATDYVDLKSKLKRRGYTNLPLTSNALFGLDYHNARRFTPVNTPVKTMLRRR